ncbi:DUF4468 domain-containing protein [Bacteroides sp.]
MKQVLFLFFCAFTLLANAQNSPLEVIKEVNLSKNELFSKTKMFISDKWNNPKRSILNEDKDSGIIQVKTEKEISINLGMGLKCIYTYEYLTKFRVKDNKYKIEIYDIKCLSAEQVGLGTTHKVPLIPYFEGDNTPDKLKSAGKGISKKKAIEMMQELRSEFSEIFNQYSKYLNEKDDF